MKTILVFLLSLAIGLVLPSPTWAHGGGGGGGGGGGSGGGGSSSAGGGGDGSGGGGGSSSSGGGGGGGSGGNGGGMGHGGANAPGMAHGGSKGLGMGHGGANAPGMAHGGGKGAARGGGFGFGHASVGNPGHNALSTRSSNSRSTSHKGGTHDGRSFSSLSHSMHSLAQHPADHSKKADQVVQVDDRGAGKEKGFVDSLPPGRELEADRGKALNPDTIHSDLDNIVTLGPPPSLELQADRGMTLNLATVHSDLDDIATRGLTPGLELNFNRGKPLPASRLAKVAPGTIVPDTDETLATALPHRWDLGDDRAKVLPSTNPELEDDDDGWRLVPYFGTVLLFLSWIVQSGLGAIKRKAARLKFEPNALRSTGSVNGPRRVTLEDRFKPSGASPPALDKVAAACSIANERQQKAADEKTLGLLEHFSGDPDVGKARAEFELAQEIEEAFHKDFDGIGLG